MAFGIMLGLIVGVMISAKASNKISRDTEKSGVWTYNDKAYKLVPIENK